MEEDLYIKLENDLYFNTDKNEILAEITKAEKVSKMYEAKAKYYEALLTASIERNKYLNEYLKLREEWEGR